MVVPTEYRDGAPLAGIVLDQTKLVERERQYQDLLMEKVRELERQVHRIDEAIRSCTAFSAELKEIAELCDRHGILRDEVRNYRSIGDPSGFSVHGCDRYDGFTALVEGAIRRQPPRPISSTDPDAGLVQIQREVASAKERQAVLETEKDAICTRIQHLRREYDHSITDERALHLMIAFTNHVMIGRPNATFGQLKEYVRRMNAEKGTR